MGVVALTIPNSVLSSLHYSSFQLLILNSSSLFWFLTHRYRFFSVFIIHFNFSFSSTLYFSLCIILYLFLLISLRSSAPSYSLLWFGMNDYDLLFSCSQLSTLSTDSAFYFPIGFLCHIWISIIYWIEFLWSQFRCSLRCILSLCLIFSMFLFYHLDWMNLGFVFYLFFLFFDFRCWSNNCWFFVRCTLHFCKGFIIDIVPLGLQKSWK